MSISEEACYLCGGKDHQERPGRVRDSESLRVAECKDCGLVSLNSFSHVKEAGGMYGNVSELKYENISELNPESMRRECYADDKRRVEFLGERLNGQRLLDFGSGVGGFLELAMEKTEYTKGIESEEGLHETYRGLGIPVCADIGEVRKAGESFDIITAFHVIEHLPDPVATMSELGGLLTEGGEMIVEVPSSDDALLTMYECRPFQSFTYWSQHLFLFNAQTLRALATKAGLRVRWLQQVQRYSLANHLHWLSKGQPGGHKHWHWLSDSALDQAYENRLATLGLSDTLMMGVGR